MESSASINNESRARDEVSSNSLTPRIPPTAREVFALVDAKVKSPQQEIFFANGYLIPLQPLHSDLRMLADLMHDPTSANLDRVIKRFRDADFDYKYVFKDANDNGAVKEILIKHHTKSTNLNPIHPYESELRALQYFKAMKLIMANSPRLKNTMEAQVIALMHKYIARRQADGNASKDTHWLADEFAKVLAKNLKISQKKARKQVTMARDLAILVEYSPSVCTIESSDRTSKVTTELSTPLQIGGDYYTREFTELDNKPWYQSAKASAGLKKATESWLDNFFKDNLDVLKKHGVPSPPSARWLPTPAANQKIETHVAKPRFDGSLDEGLSTHFIRMGITSAFHVKQVDEQVRLAKEQVKEVIRLNLTRAIAEYKNKYKDLIVYFNHKNNPTDRRFAFFIDYQTLLSPNYLEANFYALFRDNNAKFVEMAKKAVQEVADEYGEKIREDGAALFFIQTNSAINKRSGYPTAKEFEEDTVGREMKLGPIAFLLKKIASNPEQYSDVAMALNEVSNVISSREAVHKLIQPTPLLSRKMEMLATRMESGSVKGVDAKLGKEIALRMRAAFHLRQLLNNQPPYKKMSTYQRNIMMAAFEFHSMGAQSLTLVGCKSARDRTAVFAAAQKTMQENPAAMEDWNVLNEGIIKSLIEGHHFRALIHHSAIVKVDAVHEFFLQKLPEKVRTGIKTMQKFSKDLNPFQTLGQRIKSTLGISEKLSKESRAKVVAELQSESRLDKAALLETLQHQFIQYVNEDKRKEASIIKNIISEIPKFTDDKALARYLVRMETITPDFEFARFTGISNELNDAYQSALKRYEDPGVQSSSADPVMVSPKHAQHT